MKTFLLAAAGAAAIVWAAPALTHAAAPAAGAHAKATTRAEVAQKVQRRFAQLDANRDGFVTQAEAQAHAAHRPQRATKAAERMRKRAERHQPGAMFDRLDSNRDGQITRAEADAAHAARAARVQQRAASAPGGLFDRADANRDGVVTRAEFDSARAQRPQRGGMAGAVRMHAFGTRLFTMADVNRDGRVTLQEATAASLQQFDAADANRDGTVTREERRQLRQQRRSAAPQG